MDDLERELRDGLARLAGPGTRTEEPDDVAAARVVARARAGVRRRRRRRSVLAMAGAAAVVVMIGAVAVLRWEGSPEVRPAERPTATMPTPPDEPAMPGGWRLERWHDVAVYVPAGWGWGSAPVATAGSVALCGAGQVVQADGTQRAEPDLPYVGRPIALSDMCDGGWLRHRPRAPYVWLGGDVPAGRVDLGGGWVRETVAVGDVAVSVASDDPALRAAILGSAHQMPGECAARLGSPPGIAGDAGDDFVPTSMTVCAYGADARGLDYDLLLEQEATMGPAKQLMAAVEQAGDLGVHSCHSARGGEWVLLRLHGERGRVRDYVVDLACPSIAGPDGSQRVLNGETARPWATGGINAVLHAHPMMEMPDRFIQPMG